MKTDKFKIDVGSAFQYEEGIVEILYIDCIFGKIHVNIKQDKSSIEEIWGLQITRYLIEKQNIFTICNSTGDLNLYEMHVDTPGVMWFVAPEPIRIAAKNESHAYRLYFGNTKGNYCNINFIKHLK